MSSLSADSAEAQAWSFRQAARPGLRAIKDHLKPFILIQVCAILMVVAYYQSPAVQSFSASLASIKVQGGYLFAAISTAFAGVVLPEVFKTITRDPLRYGMKELTFNLVVFGLNGMIVDAFYRLQGAIFGGENTFAVVTPKVLVDQIVFSPFVAVPIVLTLFQLRDLRFNVRGVPGALGPRFMRNRVLPVQIVAWAYWTPMTIAIYALPMNLQFCLFLFAEAAWSLLLVHVAKGQTVTQ